MSNVRQAPCLPLRRWKRPARPLISCPLTSCLEPAQRAQAQCEAQCGPLPRQRLCSQGIPTGAGRECGMALSPALRPKPHPDALLHVCRQWDVAPHEAAFVGDSPKDDVSCGALPSALSDPPGSDLCRSLTQYSSLCSSHPFCSATRRHAMLHSCSRTQELPDSRAGDEDVGLQSIAELQG